MSVTYLSEWLKKQETISESVKNSQSKQTMPWDAPGAKHTESKDFHNDLDQLMAFHVVLDKAQRNPFTVKSNFSRQAAFFVAVAASTGLITTEVDYETFGKRWLITDEGEEFLEGINERIEELL